MQSPGRIIVLFCLVLFYFGCATDQMQSEIYDPKEFKALTNVTYGNDPKQTYDIYLPKNRGLATKTMILIHGGGWNEGDKSDMTGFKDFINEQLPDLAIVNINYRLATADNSPYPMQINDISSVINDLKSKQNEYQIGSELGFMGVSAGGHLSLLWSYAFDTRSQVKMVCSIVGPTNLADESYLNSENVELQNLIFQFGTDIELLKEVSPLYSVKSSSPPTILFYGGQDPLIPNSQGIDLDSKLTELNVTHEFTLYPNGGHGWIGPDFLDTSIKLRAFIETHL